MLLEEMGGDPGRVMEMLRQYRKEEPGGYDGLRRRAWDRRQRRANDRRFGAGMQRDRGRDQGPSPDPLTKTPKLPAPGTLAGDAWERDFWQRRQDAYYSQIRQAQKQRAISDLRVAQEAYSAAMNGTQRPGYAYDSSQRDDFDRRFPMVKRIGIQG